MTGFGFVALFTNFPLFRYKFRSSILTGSKQLPDNDEELLQASQHPDVAGEAEKEQQNWRNAF